MPALCHQPPPPPPSAHLLAEDKQKIAILRSRLGPAFATGFPNLQCCIHHLRSHHNSVLWSYLWSGYIKFVSCDQRSSEFANLRHYGTYRQPTARPEISLQPESAPSPVLRAYVSSCLIYNSAQLLPLLAKTNSANSSLVLTHVCLTYSS